MAVEIELSQSLANGGQPLVSIDHYPFVPG
jgi:hypothetical protein